MGCRTSGPWTSAVDGTWPQRSLNQPEKGRHVIVSATDVSAVLPDQACQFDRILALEGEVYRNVAGRKTLRFSRDGKSYFLKVHLGVGWKEIIKNLIRFRLPVVSAKTE